VQPQGVLDVAVIGAGPAGCMAASQLAKRGHSVGLFHAESAPSTGRYEMLPPEVNSLLREHDLAEPFLDIGPVECPGIVSTWGSSVPYERDLIRSAYGSGWHVDRVLFDAMLRCNATKLGVWLFAGPPVRAEVCSEGWLLNGKRARFVFDASGRTGAWIGSRPAFQTDDVMIAIEFCVENVSAPGCDQRAYLESSPDGWWYSAPRATTKQSVVTFFTAADGVFPDSSDFRRMSESATVAGLRLRAGRIRSSRRLYVPSRFRKPASGRDWLTTGDSLSSYDPLSGGGVYKAMRQGIMAGSALEDVLAGHSADFETYEAWSHAEFQDYVTERRRVYACEQRWCDLRFWQGRQC
jgi:flavin-dependent dehydrogenase